MSTKTLYDLCVQSLSKNYFTVLLIALPANAMFDVMYQTFNNSNYQLKTYLSDLQIVSRLMNQFKKERPNIMHYMFQTLMDTNQQIGNKIVDKYKDLCKSQNKSLFTNDSNDCRDDPSANKLTKAKFGLYFGTFLKEGGWYELSIRVFRLALGLYEREELSSDRKVLRIVFECKLKCLSVLNSFCYFEEGMTQMKEIQDLIDTNDKSAQPEPYNVAQVYAEFSQLFYCQSYYNESYKWALKSIESLSPQTPIITVIDVYRQAAKTSVVMREFKMAETLINQAMIRCKEAFGVNEVQNKYWTFRYHLKVAEVFEDYGFFLRKVDLFTASVELYRMALGIRKYIFGLDNDVINLLLAESHEELGYAWYALYLQKYRRPELFNACDHMNKGLDIVSRLVSDNHFLLASAKRVKALILEEISNEDHDEDEKHLMLDQARELHLSALDMARKAFGEYNAQTAKHYGDLGRLYQSMKLYNEAEAMHQKAIGIKEQLLGPNDYEVALTLSDLASIFEDSDEYEKAIEMYLRSIRILIKLPGIGSPDLVSDLRALHRLYSNLNYFESPELVRRY